jgi:hypothetical protein
MKDDPPTEPSTSHDDCVGIADPEKTAEERAREHAAFVAFIQAQAAKQFPNGLPNHSFGGFAGSPAPLVEFPKIRIRAQEPKLANALSSSSPKPAHPVARSRERRARTRTASAVSSGDDGPEPPLRACAGCGAELFGNRRSDRRYCGADCRNRAKARRHYERNTSCSQFTALGEFARDAIRDGADPELTLSLVVWPTPAIRRALAEVSS